MLVAVETLTFPILVGISRNWRVNLKSIFSKTTVVHYREKIDQKTIWFASQYLRRYGQLEGTHRARCSL